MKKKIFITFGSIITIFFISLPITRYRLEEKIIQPSLPSSITELDSYLSESESKFGDVVSGAEKKSFGLMANKNKQNTPSFIFMASVLLVQKWFRFLT